MYLGSLGKHLGSLKIDGNSGLTPNGSDGHRLRLPVLVSDQLPLVRSSILFDFAFTKHPPHSHDRRPTRLAHQEHSHRHGGDWNRWVMQGHRHHARRVLRSLRCELVIGNRTIERQEQRVEYILAYPRSDSGSCYPMTPIFGKVSRYDDGFGRSSLRYSSFYESPTRAR